MDFLPQSFEALRAYNQFIVYKLVPHQGRSEKMDKIPINYRTERAFNSHDPSIWLSAEVAITAAKRLGENYGIGFVLTEKDPFWFLDIDNCRNDSNGNCSPLAQKLCKKFNGAAIEVSSSRQGLHIIGSGAAPLHSCKNTELSIEFYTEKRFIALTGIDAKGDAGLACWEQELTLLVDKYFSTDVPFFTSGNIDHEWEVQIQQGVHPSWHGPKSDGELIKRALHSSSRHAFNEKKATFKDLWNANTAVLATAYPHLANEVGYDESSADAALAKHLAFWTGNDYERILRLMQQSSLYREKWKREDYLKRTIFFACKTQAQFYNEKFSKNQNEHSRKGIQLGKYPELNERMKPLNTYGNLKFMLDTLGITARWNDMSRKREIAIPNHQVFYDDQENSALNEIINRATFNGMPTSRIDEHLNSIAQSNHYHPIIESMISKPWDGVERLDEFIATLKTTNDNFSRVLLRKWMISAMEAIFKEKGFSAQGVLVLQGAQGIGKTRWIKSLDPISCDAVKEGALLDPTNKDNLITLASYWIVELGELDATFRKSDVAKLKSHITNQIDELRMPYARKNSQFARRTVYAATVNETRFLIDDTGNRRWWTIEILSINLDHDLDMQQVWAEVNHIRQNGESSFLTKDEVEQLSKSNEEFEQLDPFEEKVFEMYDWTPGWQQHKPRNVTATQVLAEIGYTNPSKSETTRMGKILSKLTGRKADRRQHTIPRKKDGHFVGF